MHLMGKLVLNYFFKIGSLLGVIQFNYNAVSFVATKSNAKQIYSIFINTVLAILFPTMAYIYFLIYNKTFGQNGSSVSLMKLAYIYEMLAQISTYIVVVGVLIHKNSSKVIDLMNTGSELIQHSVGSFPNSFFWVIILKILLFDWMREIFVILTYLAYTQYTFNEMWMMIVTSVCCFVNIFVGNIFFCGIFCAGRIFKVQNKQLKTILQPLKKNQKLTHLQLLEISDKIDQKMVLHAKIGKFVEDLNEIFSLIGMMMLLEAFVIITEELYSFYASSRMANAEASTMSVITAFFYAILVFSFVYASNHITEQVDKTGDILKVFVDTSVDDRLKNSVN